MYDFKGLTYISSIKHEGLALHKISLSQKGNKWNGEEKKGFHVTIKYSDG